MKHKISHPSLLLSALGTLALALLFSTTVEAQPWGGGGHGWRGRGHGRGMGMGRRGRGRRGMGMMSRRGMGLRGGRALRCTRRLFHQDPTLLKQELGLNDAQIKKIHGYRNNMWLKTAAARGKMASLGAKMRIAMDADIPSEGKVLNLMRQLRATRGTIMEEHLKAGLWALKTLTSAQRTTLRQTCRRGMKRRWRQRRFRRNGGGPGRGMGPGSGQGPR